MIRPSFAAAVSFSRIRCGSARVGDVDGVAIRRVVIPTTTTTTGTTTGGGCGGDTD